jgi:DNA repair protein RadC
MKIKSLPFEERPREKLIRFGATSLTNSELLAIILRTGNKNENVINLCNNLLSVYNLKSLSRLNISVLKRQTGIGDAKACQIVACFELGKRLSAFSEEKNPVIKNPETIAGLFLPEMSSLEKEEFRIIFLDSRRRMIKCETIFVGSLNESLVNAREIFKRAMEENSAAIILMHNHPSGETNPSEYDIETTKEIVKIGTLLGIPVLDHIIIGSKEYVSLREKNIIKD